MRLDNFWSFVGEHPWFLELVNIGEYTEGYRSRRQGTRELGVHLTKTLPESVEWIAPRPWSSHVLDMKDSQCKNGEVVSAKEVVRGKHTVETVMHFKIFWHFKVQSPFDEPPFARHVELYEEEDVGGAIKQIRERYPRDTVIIDVVVRIHNRRTKPWRCSKSRESLAFDLYFPGSNQSVTQKSR